jgi:hypothetical protein
MCAQAFETPLHLNDFSTRIIEVAMISTPKLCYLFISLAALGFELSFTFAGQVLKSSKLPLHQAFFVMGFF